MNLQNFLLFLSLFLKIYLGELKAILYLKFTILYLNFLFSKYEIFFIAFAKAAMSLLLLK